MLEKSELLRDRKYVRIFCFYQRHDILRCSPEDLDTPGLFALSFKALFFIKIIVNSVKIYYNNILVQSKSRDTMIPKVIGHK